MLRFALCHCAALTFLAGCSYIKPSLTVNESGAVRPSSTSDSEFVTAFESCFAGHRKIPKQEALTRQLFVGWTDVSILAPVTVMSTLDSGTPQRSWQGFTVSGSLDSQPYLAVAVATASNKPGCIAEVVAFTKNESKDTHIAPSSPEFLGQRARLLEKVSALISQPSFAAELGKAPTELGLASVLPPVSRLTKALIE